MEKLPAGSGAIEGFRGRGFRVGGTDHPGGITANAAGGAPWLAADLAALTLADLPAAEDIDLILIGTGPTLHRVPATLAAEAARAGITLEAMDSRAAARTYNMLLAEGRRVAVALLPL